jgi:hypothetical protein
MVRTIGVVICHFDQKSHGVISVNTLNGVIPAKAGIQSW